MHSAAGYSFTVKGSKGFLFNMVQNHQHGNLKLPKYFRTVDRGKCTTTYSFIQQKKKRDIDGLVSFFCLFFNDVPTSDKISSLLKFQ